MRRLLGLVFAVFAATFLLASFAGTALASDVHCGDVITADATLNGDLSGCPGDGLVIGARDITIDLEGHTVAGTGKGYGINNAAGYEGVTVKNGIVQGFGTDVYARGDHQTFDNLRVGGILDACCRGATSEPAIGNQVLDSHIFGRSHGPASSIRLGTESLLRDSQINDGGAYVMSGKVAWNYIESLDSSVLTTGGTVAITGNWLLGAVSVRGPGTAKIDHNVLGSIAAGNESPTPGSVTIDSNQIGGGLGISGNVCAIITGNQISGLGLRGGCASETGPCITATGNGIVGSSGNGVFIVPADDSGCGGGYRIAQNSILSHRVNGIFAAAGDLPVRITGNVVNRNAVTGIVVEAENANVTGNRVWLNGSLGIEALDDTFGRNNSASRNGSPFQCVPISLCTVVPTL